MTTIDDIRAAAGRIADGVHRTPTTRQSSLGALAGVELHVKAELFQRTGSFKIRGVLNTVRTLSDEERANGLVTMSAGNHAAALAYAAALAGTTAVVVMPHTANPGKIAATRSYGGEVLLTEAPLLDTLTEVRERSGRTLVHPFDDPRVIAGAGTVALEILEDVPEPDVIVVQAGGGGLLSGVVTAVRALRPETRVYGVEPYGADAMALALEAGEPVHIRPVSVADALCAPYAGQHNVDHVAGRVDGMVRIDDDAIRHGVRMTFERAKYAVEPAGATGIAALLAGALPVEPGERVVAIASGGNVDAATLAQVLAV